MNDKYLESLDYLLGHYREELVEKTDYLRLVKQNPGIFGNSFDEEIEELESIIIVLDSVISIMRNEQALLPKEEPKQERELRVIRRG